jgi:hypothetical protein
VPVGVTANAAPDDCGIRPHLRGFLDPQVGGMGSGAADIYAERARLEATRAPAVATAEKILELAKKAEILYKIAESWRTAQTARNGAIELHVRPRKS